MRKITELTRRDLQDIITTGFYVRELINPDIDCEYDTVKGKYKIFMSFCGRLSEVDFLNRLYPLDSMPSNDYRFSSAKVDIYQHRENNYDWDDFWFFSDRRFDLSHGHEDEPFLRFICEMLHPAVLEKNSPWEEYVKKFNEILCADGYEIFSAENISGYDVFQWREIDHIEVKTAKEKFSWALKQIGEGSYAKVFKYRDEFYQTDFVVKRAKKNLEPKELERFQREYEQMLNLRSPYVVKVYQYNEQRHEYIMEYMDSTLLKYVSDYNDKLDIKKRVAIGLQLFRAYGYIHSKGILHRDISPNNVLLRFYDDAIIVKISDFGLVKLKESDLTSDGTDFKGSFNDPALRVEGFVNYTFSHEVYALTLLLAYLLTGKTNLSNIKDEKLKEFIGIGTNPDKTKRFENLEKMKDVFLKCANN